MYEYNWLVITMHELKRNISIATYVFQAGGNLTQHFWIQGFIP